MANTIPLTVVSKRHGSLKTCKNKHHAIRSSLRAYEVTPPLLQHTEGGFPTRRASQGLRGNEQRQLGAGVQLSGGHRGTEGR